MFQRLAAVLLLFVFAGAPALAQSAPADDERVLVVGQLRGPGLWKVHKGDHVLWIFATYAPLPKGFLWRAREVENALAGAQEFIGEPGIAAGVGFWKGLTLAPYLIGLTKNPDGAQLRDVLPPEVYARWVPLKQKYLGKNDGIEFERPMFAADALYNAGLSQNGLSPRSDARETIAAIVKAKGIRQTSTVLQLEMADPKRLLKDFKKAPMDDVACFSATLARLENDLDGMRLRANAWAKGDLETIARLDFTDSVATCKSAMLNNSVVRRTAQRPIAELVREKWLAAVEKALDANTSTFATLPLRDILDPQGLLSALRAKGYRVDAPD